MNILGIVLQSQPMERFQDMTRILSVVLLATLVAGCQAKQTNLPILHYGMTYEEIDDVITADNQHQFTALVNDEVFRCYMVEFGDRAGARYYLLFREDYLFSIVESAPFFEWEVIVRNGSNVSIQAPWDSEDRMQRILTTEPLTIEEFQVDATAKLDEAATVDRGASNIPAPVWVVLSPLWVPTALKENRKMDKWAKRFSPEALEIGMSTTQVDDIYGPPTFVLPGKTKETRVYGPSEKLRQDGQKVSIETGIRSSIWTAVVLEHNHVTRVFSDSLFDESNLVKAEYLVQP